MLALNLAACIQRSSCPTNSTTSELKSTSCGVFGSERTSQMDQLQWQMKSIVLQQLTRYEELSVCLMNHTLEWTQTVRPSVSPSFHRRSRYQTATSRGSITKNTIPRSTPILSLRMIIRLSLVSDNLVSIIVQFKKILVFLYVRSKLCRMWRLHGTNSEHIDCHLSYIFYNPENGKINF